MKSCRLLIFNCPQNYRQWKQLTEKLILRSKCPQNRKPFFKDEVTGRRWWLISTIECTSPSSRANSLRSPMHAPPLRYSRIRFDQLETPKLDPDPDLIWRISVSIDKCSFYVHPFIGPCTVTKVVHYKNIEIMLPWVAVSCQNLASVGRNAHNQLKIGRNTHNHI